jgi:chromosomal replication initiation ATPase DnaA
MAMPAQEKAFRLSLCETLGEQRYANWFAPAGVECTPSGVILSVANAFLRDHIDANFSWEIAQRTGQKIEVKVAA